MAKAAEPADGQAGASTATARQGPGREGLVDLYRQMVLVRMFEESCQRSFRKGAIGGYLHLDWPGGHRRPLPGPRPGRRQGDHRLS